MNRRVAVVVFGLLAAGLDEGCVGTETGNPPAAPDPMFIAERDDPSTEPDAIRLAGDPGAVDPAEGEVVVLTVDVLRDPVRTPVREDGSFGPVSSVAPLSGTLRLWVERDGDRSPPVDVVRLEDGSLPAAPIALADCLDVDPPRELVLEESAGRVVLSNGCEVDVELGAPRLRDGSSGVTVTGAAATLAPGGTAEIEVTVQDGGEDVLLLPIDAPESGRRVVTLRRR